MSTSSTPPRALTIAGSDSGGGAGIQADLRTFNACRVHGMTAVTAVTVQDTVRVSGFVPIPTATVVAQIEAVVTDIGVQAVKTGMLASAEIITAVAETCDRLGIGRSRAVPLVVDPVAASMHGDSLLHADALEALRSELIPRASLVTPNLDELRMLTGVSVRSSADLGAGAEAVLRLGPAAALVKSGHLTGEPDCVDLYDDGAQRIELPSERFDTQNTHGGGDTFAAAITAALATGFSLVDAVWFGKRLTSEAVRNSYPLGAGYGPVAPVPSDPAPRE